MAYFDGKEAKVIRNPGEIQVFYGGFLTPDGNGHGHVRATGGPLGENIVYWRLPDSEGGQVIVSNRGTPCTATTSATISAASRSRPTWTCL